MHVQVCLTLPGAVVVRDLDVPEGTTAAQAAIASALVAADWAGEFGVYGVRVEPDHRLASEDRVELYHALPTEPRARRRARAALRRPPGDAAD